MKSKYTYIIFICMIIYVLCAPRPAGAVEPLMADYTAYPPFITSGAVEPNILLVLDHSGSMQFPAYIGCDFAGYSSNRANCGTSDTITNTGDRYLTTTTYYGYFKTDKYYQYDGQKFIENAACVYTAADPEYLIGNLAGTCRSGNLLNWAAMSRIDLMRKVLIGGKSLSTQTNTHTLRAEGGWRTFSDHTLGCTFTLSGGSFPHLDHSLSISNYTALGTTGLLTVWSNGNNLWGTADQFRFVYQNISGDFDVRLRVIKPPTESGQTFAKAGLMIRASTNTGSRHVKAMLTNLSGLQFSYRATSGGDTTLLGNYVAIAYPAWVRIVRSGNTFTNYYSSDGAAWTLHSSITVDIPSDALIGMATSAYSTSTLGKAEYDQFTCTTCTGATTDDFNDQLFDPKWTALDINTTIAGSQTESGSTTCKIGTLAAANLKVDIPENERKGIVHNLADKDYNGTWDDDSPRFGLMVFASDSANLYNRKGEIRVGIEGANMSSFLTAIQGEAPYGGTPLGEALYEAYDYYTQVNSYPYEDNNAFIGGPGSTKDPMYSGGGPLRCRKSFVLVISDGEWDG
ncbi:MAG: DUF1349 domain-containing protein, partial [Nitrospirota bacterium]|nr:DUF1349 domain-containing protein [Nitrospirota bacterium]